MSNKQQAATSGPPANGRITASIGAIVTAVPEGKKPFAVAYPLPESATEALTNKTSITFTIPDCWSGGEQSPPKFGQVVTLGGIERFVHGWRASSACPMSAESSKQQAGEKQ